MLFQIALITFAHLTKASLDEVTFAYSITAPSDLIEGFKEVYIPCILHLDYTMQSGKKGVVSDFIGMSNRIPFISTETANNPPELHELISNKQVFFTTFYNVHLPVSIHIECNRHWYPRLDPNITSQYPEDINDSSKIEKVHNEEGELVDSIGLHSYLIEKSKDYVWRTNPFIVSEDMLSEKNTNFLHLGVFRLSSFEQDNVGVNEEANMPEDNAQEHNGEVPRQVQEGGNVPQEVEESHVQKDGNVPQEDYIQEGDNVPKKVEHAQEGSETDKNHPIDYIDTENTQYRPRDLKDKESSLILYYLKILGIVSLVCFEVVYLCRKWMKTQEVKED